MEQIRSKPAFPRKATGKTWVFQERQKANQPIAGTDKNIDIKTRRPGHGQAQFYIRIFNNFLLRLNFSFHDILSVKFIFLVFHSTEQGLLLVDSWLKSNVFRSWAMYPALDTLQHVIELRSMVESGVTAPRREKHGQFSFSWMNTKIQTRNLKLKCNSF